MFDHIGLRTAEFARLKLFYEAALQPLALAVLAEYPGGVGFGRDGQPAFWIGESERAPSSVHIAFQAQSHADVDAFYAAAMNAGAVDNGAPGLRPHFHADYYGAFVLPCARTQWPVAMELGRTRCGRSNRGLLARCQGARSCTSMTNCSKTVNRQGRQLADREHPPVAPTIAIVNCSGLRE